VASRRELEATARELLEANTQQGEKDGATFTFTVPSARAYPFQWFWDSCFHAIVWSRFDVERAKEELRGLFAWQHEDGFIPHVIFWNRALTRRVPLGWHSRESRALFGRPNTTARLQPPVLAQAVERIVEAGGDDEYLRETLPALARYHRFLTRDRDVDGDGLLTIISSFESGLDYSPVYDHPNSLHVDDSDPLQPDPWWVHRRELIGKLLGHRARRVQAVRRHAQKDVHFTSVYAHGVLALARLAERAGDRALADWAGGEAADVREALLDKCWDAPTGLFYNLAGRRERPVCVKAIQSLMPLILPGLPAEVVESLVTRLTDRDDFWPEYPVPSVALSEPAFNPRRTRLIWRGPLSLNTNWFLTHALRQYGGDRPAETIAERSRALVERHGFNEFYNPLSGEPVGVEAFGWATLAVDL
jgi:glycogen debranching enzyme